ncbi:Hypothetical protein (Fragment) [Durusdinium trenchii]|uniref:DUF8003 domain-containing protein n=1 Tax=Durusdinium trenchii TaxID=1381693 RepID=A0ABP0I1N9_9DINO
MAAKAAVAIVKAMAPEAHSPPALRRAERQRFAEAFEAFKAPNAKEGLSVGGFVKLCQRCFRFSDTFGANEAEEIFWEVVLPGGEMDLQGLDTALSLIAWRFGRAAGALKRAVSLAGWTWLDPGVGGGGRQGSGKWAPKWAPNGGLASSGGWNELLWRKFEVRPQRPPQVSDGFILRAVLGHDNDTCILAPETCSLDWGKDLILPVTWIRFRRISSPRNLPGSRPKDHSGTGRALELLGNDRERPGMEVLRSAAFCVQHVINCPNGTVEATAKSFLQVAYGTLAVRAKEISFPDFLVQLICNAINLNSDYLTFRARILQGAQLQALSRVGQADLGWVGGTWRLESFVLGAQSVVFASDFRVEVLGDSCRWGERSWGQRSTFWFMGLEEGVWEAEMGICCLEGQSFTGAELWHCAEKGGGFLVDGGGGRNTRLEYSSGGGALWLSSSVLSLGRSSDLVGQASGGLISADGLPGGMVPGPQVMTRPDGRRRNPGMVASGGGAVGLEHNNLAYAYAKFTRCAGGQILISIKDLKLLAPAPLPETTATTTDPGGAPEDEGDQPPKLTATGGAAQCISARKSVGGAGGGGFIGLWWRSLPSAPGKGGKGRKHRGATTHEELEDRVTLDVSGGPLTETCEDVLPQQLHQEVAGADGLAISLTTCPLGRAGAFCAACPVGHWGDGVHCMSCTNKPNPSAFYVRNAWPNASCPYYCALGVPEVVINPKCLSNYAFAASFFGGEMGFWSFLLCPVSIFLILRTAQWLRRKRKRTLGRWQFPREELPCHLGRIFLLGDNSPGSPWRLPHMSTTGAAAQAAQALAPEGWQVLEESLAKPLKSLGRRGRRKPIPSWESWRLFRWSPWSQLLLRKMRRARARRAERAVRLLRGELTLWKDAGDDGSKPCIKFDCDDSATTGYLDLFDFRRSGMDWAPGNLKEEQILVAQGAGSWARPYELNVGDPLLLGVAQSQGQLG